MLLDRSADASPASIANDSRPLRTFFSVPSTRLTGAADSVRSLQARTRADEIRQALLDVGVTVYASHHDEHWASLDNGAGPRVPGPFRAIQGADVVVAYLCYPMSSAVCMELGWATALRKPVVLLVDQALTYKTLIEELQGITEILAIKDNRDWSDTALRQTLVTALDWSDQTFAATA